MNGGSGIGAAAGAPPRERIDWVDALKGVGIVAVVAGHVWTSGPARDAIYAVHMPLFFLLSGYTARSRPWRVLLPACLRSLVVPFLCFCALLLAADFLIEGLRGVRPIFADWRQGGWNILMATEKTRGPFTILWFIPCLFIARLAWNALSAGNRRPDSPAMIPVMLLVYGLALAGHLWGQWSPLGLLAVPAALLMLWAGALWRHWGMPTRGLVAALAIVAGAALLLAPPLNMKQGDLGWPSLSLAGAAAATVLLGLLVQRLPAVPRDVFARLGRASLGIMYLHVAFIHYLRPHASAPLLFVLALAASWLIEALLRRFGPTRRLLLGGVDRNPGRRMG